MLDDGVLRNALLAGPAVQHPASCFLHPASPMPRSAFWLTAALVLAGLLGMRETRRADGLLIGVDARFVDWLMANAGNPGWGEPAAVTVGVTLVEIDDATLRERGGGGGGGVVPLGTATAEVPEPPLSALDYALFLQGAEGLGAAVVAVEPVLAWPRERQEGEFERILLNQALRTPKLLLAVRAAGGRRRPPAPGTSPVPPVENRPLSPLAGSGGGLPTAPPATVVAPLRRVRGDISGLPELADLARRPAERLLLAGTPGPADLPPAVVRPDGDGISRAVPLLFRGPEGEVLPAFTLQAAILLYRLTPDEVSVDLDARVVELGPVARVPVDGAGAMRADFTGGRRVPRFALDDFLLAASGSNAAAASRPPAGGVVLIGRRDTAAAGTLELPTGETGAPVELLAAALDTLGRRWFVARAPWFYDLLIIAGIVVLGRAFLPLRRGAALALTGAFFLVYTLLALAVFELGRLWLPWALPTGLLLTLGLILAGLAPTGMRPPESPHAEVAKEAERR